DTAVALAEETDDADFHDASMLPGDRGVLFVVHGNDGKFDRIDVFADGERRTVLEMTGNDLESPSWSPSGHLVFRRRDSNVGVWAAPFSLDRLEVTGEPFLAYPDASLPDASRNGNLVLSLGSHGAAGCRIAWVDRSGVVQGTPETAYDQSPYFALSADSDRMILRVNGEDVDLWIVDLVRSTRTRLTFSERLRESFPTWSPNGRHVYYHDAASFPNTGLWVTAADGTAEPESLGVGSFADVSPDGGHMVFTRAGEGSGDFDIWHWELGQDGRPTGEARLFLDTEAALWGTRFSPDGRFLAYSSSESGRSEVYLKPFPSGAGKWQVSADGGNWAHWKEDGSELYYTDVRDVMMVSVSTDPTVRLGRPQELFSRPRHLGVLPAGWADGFAVTPDGERFLVALPGDDDEETEAAPGLVVVQNWFSEFAGE
ncbi:MAG TPA: hypothetical protein VKU85_07270, partial [bacterium]|nr:hypothetical protein [bacterium]